MISKSFHDALWSFSLPSAKSPLSSTSFSEGSIHILALTRILYFSKSRASPKPSQVMAAPTSILQITGPESEMVALLLFCYFPTTVLTSLLKNSSSFDELYWFIILHATTLQTSMILLGTFPYSLKILAHPSLLFKRLHMTQ